MKPISFKGIRGGLKVCFAGPLLTKEEVVTALQEGGDLVLNQPLFFDFGDLPLTRRWVLELYATLIAELNLTLTGFTASTEEGQQVLAFMGLNRDAQNVSLSEQTTAIITKQLRSGQCFNHDGDVILVGDLHDGAEIQATGSVCVLGQLKGLVHAGCEGDDTKSVISMCYLANHIRIGTKVSQIDDASQCSWWGKGVTITLKNGVFVARELKLDKGASSGR